MWQKFLDWLKRNKGIEILIGLVLLSIVIIVSMRNEDLKKKVEVAEYNLTVANDTLRVTKDKQGKDEYNKLAYLTDKVENLAKLNTDLAKAVSDIKGGKVSTIIQEKVKIVEKPVPFIVKSELIDSNLFARFTFDTTYSPGNYRKLSGYTKYDLRNHVVSGQKEVDEIGLKITTGIKNLDQGKPEIFFKSDYPGLEVTEMTGAVLNPDLFKPKNKTPLITPVLAIGWQPIIYQSGKGIEIQANSWGATVGLGFNLFKLLGVKK